MKRLLLVFSMLFVAFSGFSQSEEADLKAASENNNKGTYKYGPYATRKWYDNFFIGGSYGGNWLVNGINPQNMYFLERYAPALDAYLGKWITPDVGFRLQFNGLSANGFSGADGKFAGKETGSGYYQNKFNIRLYHLDLIFNLSNAISGYKEKRFWDFVPFFGFGYAESYKNGLSPIGYFSVYAGFYNSLRVTKWMDIVLEFKCMAADKRFDGYTGGLPLDLLPMATGGLSFNLPPFGFKRSIKPDYKPLRDEISSLKGDVEAAKSALAGTKSTLRDAQMRNIVLEDSLRMERKKPAMVATVTDVPPVALFFDLGKAVLSSKELVNMQFFLTNVLKKDPNKVFTLTGMADSSTGSAAFNQKLSEKRINFVRNLMIKKYKIKDENIKTIVKGSTADLFDAPELNRIVMIQ